MRSRIACSAALAALAALGAAPAVRAEPTAAERAVAETLFRDAKKLMARGKVPEACAKFAASYAIDAAGGTLLNLAMCHEVEGKTATAWAEFNEALSLARKQGRADRLKAASEHIAALEARLSRVRLTAPAGGAPPGLTVRIDGAVVAPEVIGTAIPVDPGDHVVTATATERLPWEGRLAIKEGQRQDLLLPALKSATPAAPPPTPVRWKLPAGIAALGAGAVLLGVGTYFGVRAVSLGGKVGEQCPRQACSPEGQRALADGRSAAGAANGTLAAGGALAVAGTALVIVAALSPPALEAPRVGRLRLELSPMVGPRGASLTVGGAF
jgi:hypothetical protein